MDEKEYERMGDAALALGRELLRNHDRNHVNSVTLHLYPAVCGHAELPHICVGLDTLDPDMVNQAKALISPLWEGFPVFVNPGRPIRFAADHFEEGWFDPNSYENTLKYVLQKSDPDWIAGHNADDLAKALYHELVFLSPYSDSAEELQKVREYIATHKEELHVFIIDYFIQKKSA